jgi:hypothetical protein
MAANILGASKIANVINGSIQKAIAFFVFGILTF